MDSRVDRVKVVAFDVDGCLTPGTEFLIPDGQVVKVRSYIDGQGISLMRAIGLRVVFITAEKGSSSSGYLIKTLVDKWNKLPSSQSDDNPHGWPPVILYTGDDGWDKGSILSAFCQDFGFQLEECAVMGDDLVDVPMLRLAGFKAAPVQAEDVIKEMADWISARPGGYGAVRDLANFFLKVKGINPLGLPPY